MSPLHLFLALIASQVPPIFCVIGGRDVKPHEFPFMAWAYNNNNFMRRVGVLISPQHVLTTKIFGADQNVDQVTFRFGKTERGDEQDTVRMGVRNITLHPEEDAAIITLDKQVVLSDHVKAIKLPANLTEDYVGQTTILVGGDGDYEKLMMKVDLKMVASSKCGKSGRAGKGGLPEKFICATSPEGTPPPKQDRSLPWHTGCYEDSGAPLIVCPSSDTCTVVGLVNMQGPGDTSCAGDVRGPRVAFLLPWIRDVMESGPLEPQYVKGWEPTDLCVTPGTSVNFKWQSVLAIASEAAYTACSGLTNAAAEEGTTWVAPALGPGEEATINYFACGVTGHCEGGMKARIETREVCAR